MTKNREITDISVVTDTILIYRQKPIFEGPIRCEIDNIDIGDTSRYFQYRPTFRMDGY